MADYSGVFAKGFVDQENLMNQSAIQKGYLGVQQRQQEFNEREKMRSRVEQNIQATLDNYEQGIKSLRALNKGNDDKAVRAFTDVTVNSLNGLMQEAMAGGFISDAYSGVVQSRIAAARAMPTASELQRASDLPARSGRTPSSAPQQPATPPGENYGPQNKNTPPAPQPATTVQPLSGGKGEEFLASLPPEQASQIKAIAEGRMQPPTSFALKTEYWQDMLKKVAAYDPGFDLTMWKKRSDTLKDFSSGRASQNVTALNTVLGHLGSLKETAEALNNSTLPGVNRLANAAISEVGDSRVKAYEVNKKAVADELAKVFVGTGTGALADREEWLAKLDSASSPAQFEAIFKNVAELLQSRIDAVGEQYSRGMGRPQDGLELLDPNARKVFEELNGRKAPSGTDSKLKGLKDKYGLE